MNFLQFEGTKGLEICNGGGIGLILASYAAARLVGMYYYFLYVRTAA